MASPALREKFDAYFSSLNSTSSRIMADIESIRQNNSRNWNNLSYDEQSNVLWESLVRPDIETKYKLYPISKPEVDYFPVLRINPGEKVVVDEDNSAGKTFGCSWRDEHSAPFSWETQSQLDLHIFDDTAETEKKTVETPQETKIIPKEVVKDNSEENETPNLVTELLPPAVASVVSSLNIVNQPLYDNSAVKQPEKPISKKVQKEIEKYEKEVKAERLSKDLSKESDVTGLAAIKKDPQNSSQGSIPKTGFDFLDNW